MASLSRALKTNLSDYGSKGSFRKNYLMHMMTSLERSMRSRASASYHAQMTRPSSSGPLMDQPFKLSRAILASFSPSKLLSLERLPLEEMTALLEYGLPMEPVSRSSNSRELSGASIKIHLVTSSSVQRITRSELSPGILLELRKVQILQSLSRN